MNHSLTIKVDALASCVADSQRISHLTDKTARLSVPKLAKKLVLKQHFAPVQPDLQRVESRIKQQADFFDPGIHGYIEYATETSGKRIRPALVLLASHATGGCKEEHIDLAVIIELIHLASLVHDDVLDNAQIRRAKPTSNSKWGTELSVLLGDCLFAHALKLCTHFDDNQICRQIADAANEVCAGEILQTQRRFDLKLPVSDYLRMIAMKTGALFRVSTELSAYLNGLPSAGVEAYRIYGDSIGIAYQIYDDCLDLFGSEDGSGKTLGTDLKKGKLTLPMLHMLQQLGGSEMEKVSESILHGDDSGRDELRRRIVDMGGHTYSVRKAQDYLEKAARILDGVPQNGFVETLKTFALGFARELEVLKS